MFTFVLILDIKFFVGCRQSYTDLDMTGGIYFEETIKNLDQTLR